MFRTTTSPVLAAALMAACTACAADAPSDAVTDGEARSADGVAIRYDVRGAGDPALVLVHGWTNAREIWGEHPATLARTHRVVTVDLAGHGESGTDRAEWTIPAFGDDVTAVADALELERMVLVGFSMGGGVVLEAAERLGERVMGIVFVDAFHDPDQRIPAQQAEQFESGVRAAWGDTAFVRAFAYTPDTPDSLVLRMAALLPPEPADHYFDVFRGMANWIATDFEATLAGLDVPVAAINTPNPPTRVEAIRRLAPGFTVDTIAGVGHAGILHQRVEDFDALLRALVTRFEGQAGR